MTDERTDEEWYDLADQVRDEGVPRTTLADMQRDRAQSDGLAEARRRLDQHTPSITEKAEQADPNGSELVILANKEFGFYEYDGAYRECACGVILDGYYEYVDHLKEVLK